MTAFEMADFSEWRPFGMAAPRNGGPSEWRADTKATWWWKDVTDMSSRFD